RGQAPLRPVQPDPPDPRRHDQPPRHLDSPRLPGRNQPGLGYPCHPVIPSPCHLVILSSRHLQDWGMRNRYMLIMSHLSPFLPRTWVKGILPSLATLSWNWPWMTSTSGPTSRADSTMFFDVVLSPASL